MVLASSMFTVGPIVVHYGRRVMDRPSDLRVMMTARRLVTRLNGPDGTNDDWQALERILRDPKSDREAVSAIGSVKSTFKFRKELLALLPEIERAQPDPPYVLFAFVRIQLGDATGGRLRLERIAQDSVDPLTREAAARALEKLDAKKS